MNLIAPLLLFASVVYASPQFFQPKFGGNFGFNNHLGFGNFGFFNGPGFGTIGFNSLPTPRNYWFQNQLPTNWFKNQPNTGNYGFKNQPISGNFGFHYLPTVRYANSKSPATVGTENNQPETENYSFKNQPIGNFGFKNLQKASVRYVNSESPATVETEFGTFPEKGIDPEQRAIYLPIMKALLRVLKTTRPSTEDLNTLMVLTREISKKVPDIEEGQNNLLDNIGESLSKIGDFRFGDLESMGLLESGDIVTEIDGIPHVITSFGAFPFPEPNLMTSEEKAQFMPIIKNFADVLEENGANKGKVNLLLQQSKKLAKLIPEDLRNSITGE